MRRQATLVVFAVFGFVLAGCSSRPLPPYEKPMARTQFQRVRTTAYTHTESDHLEHGCSTALGTPLRAGPINSAAADWSRWPAGTLFRIAETGELFEVDDYGWALAGTNTIDLYRSSRAAMNAWGVRRVTIENLRWGDPERSLAVLRPRAKFRHVKRMVEGFANHYPSPPTIVTTASAPPSAPTGSAPIQTAAHAGPPARTRRATLAPFYSVSTQLDRAGVR